MPPSQLRPSARLPPTSSPLASPPRDFRSQYQAMHFTGRYFSKYLQKTGLCFKATHIIAMVISKRMISSRPEMSFQGPHVDAATRHPRLLVYTWSHSDWHVEFLSLV